MKIAILYFLKFFLVYLGQLNPPNNTNYSVSMKGYFKTNWSDVTAVISLLYNVFI